MNKEKRKEKSKRRIMTQNKNKTLRSDQRGIAKGKDIRLKLKGTKQKKKNHRVNNQMIYRRIEEKQIGGKEKMAETESYFKQKKKKNSTGY